MIRLADEDICTGCALCHDICKNEAIVMRMNKEGFKYPAIDSDKCIECRKCERICPSINDINEFHESKIALYGRKIDDITRSSSGGMYISLANTILQDGGGGFWGNTCP